MSAVIAGGASAPVLFFDDSKSWSDLGVERRLQKALRQRGFSTPTRCQGASLEAALAQRDVLCRAATGSGKTLCFALPVLQTALLAAQESEEGTVAVVLVPTKELCLQVAKELLSLMTFCRNDVSLLRVTADESAKAQVPRLKEKPSIIVATPARLAQHAKAGVVDLRSLRVLAVDEADLVLDVACRDDVLRLKQLLPRAHQTLMTSATLDAEVQQFSAVVLRDPLVVDDKSEDPRSALLREFYLNVTTEEDKFLVLFALLKFGVVRGKMLFFVNSVDECFRLQLLLRHFGLGASVLNAELPFNSRRHVIDAFNRGVTSMLVATDAAAGQDGSARGVDFKHVDVVVNFELPLPADESDKSSKKDNDSMPADNAAAHVLDVYTHRVGRTARGGAKGLALTLVSPSEASLLEDMREEQMKRDSCDRPRLQPLPALDMADVERFRYRVDDVRRKVSKNAIREARVRQLKTEVLNSEKLRAHFEENPRELELLQHNTYMAEKPQAHLAKVPKYLKPANASALPQLQHEQDFQAQPTRAKKRRKTQQGGKDKKRRRKQDPLRAMSGRRRRK
ncbi:MAG: hypothetical protein MHM6MM_001201 [Cercozoa sp. M6MM]